METLVSRNHVEKKSDENILSEFDGKPIGLKVIGLNSCASSAMVISVSKYLYISRSQFTHLPQHIIVQSIFFASGFTNFSSYMDTCYVLCKGEGQTGIIVLNDKLFKTVLFCEKKKCKDTLESISKLQDFFKDKKLVDFKNILRSFCMQLSLCSQTSGEYALFPLCQSFSENDGKILTNTLQSLTHIFSSYDSVY